MKSFNKFGIQGGSSKARLNQTLNPILFDSNDRLLNPIKAHIQKVVSLYLNRLDISPDDVEQVILTGSNAGYNFAEASDIDLEIVIADNDDYGRRLFRSLGLQVSNLNRELAPEVARIPLNLYLKKAGAGLSVAHTGKYDVNNNAWISEPVLHPIYDQKAVSARTREWIRSISSACEGMNGENALECNKKLLKRIRNWRIKQLSLSEGSFGALVYRSLARSPEFAKIKETIASLLSELVKYDSTGVPPQRKMQKGISEATRNIFFEDIETLSAKYSPTSKKLWNQCAAKFQTESLTNLASAYNLYASANGKFFGKDKEISTIVFSIESVQNAEEINNNITDRTMASITESALFNVLTTKKLTTQVRRTLSEMVAAPRPVGKVVDAKEFTTTTAAPQYSDAWAEKIFSSMNPNNPDLAKLMIALITLNNIIEEIVS